MKPSFEMILSETATLDSGRYPGFGPRTELFDGFTKSTDVAVALRDGTTIYVDLYLPIDAADAPALVAWSPYGKHGLKSLAIMPGADVEPGWVSKHAIWEGPDPAYWCPKGYAVVSPDPRGAWGSEGTLTFYSEQEGEDGYDLIEWIGRQAWSNGKVGMLGVSYLAIAQWLIASKRPPSLAAICPWEGVSDLYRESHFHGGIPETGFRTWWQPKSRFSLSPAEDVLRMNAGHPFIDGYWQSKSFDLSAIDVPAFVVASWGDHGMHTRGTIEGFQSIGSSEKWLEIHGRKKWRHFYDPASVRKQTAFFDRFLKGGDTEVSGWPRATIEVRESNGRSFSRTASAWPPQAVVPFPLYLDCADGTMQAAPPPHARWVDYDSEDPAGRVTFDFTLPADAEFIGGAKLKLWVSTAAHDDMDLFVALQKLDAQGQPVGFRYFSTFDEGPVALGWLRASHRALDPARSTDLRPLHPHTSQEKLQPGQVVPVEIEIWPSGTVFRRGETLRLVVGGSDLYRFGTGAPELRHQADNRGHHRIWSGGMYDSHLLLPRMTAEAPDLNDPKE